LLFIIRELRDSMNLTAHIKQHRTSLSFAIRLTVAALLALWIAGFLAVRLPLWVVLTAMIVTQTSLGRTVKVALDYLIGTVLGALWGGAVALFVPHANEQALFAALSLALAPLAFLTAIQPRYATAPITAAIVLLMTQSADLSPAGSVLERLAEVGIGGCVGLIVSVLLFPSSAFQHVRGKAADALDEMAKTVSCLNAGFLLGIDADTAQSLQKPIGPLLAEISGIVGEADREKSLRAGTEETGPLLRSLLRLRHDLVMMSRAVELPPPNALAPSFIEAGRAIQEYFQSSAQMLRTGKPAPLLDAVETTIETCTSAVAVARKDGNLRSLSSDEIEHLFALGFAMEQIRRNFRDLGRCVNEWSN
jgi:Fusaric acid resistance protein-like